MLDCQIAILENAFVRYFATGEAPKPIGTRHPLTTPFQAFPTKDGWIVIAIAPGVENQWELFCVKIGRRTSSTILGLTPRAYARSTTLTWSRC